MKIAALVSVVLLSLVAPVFAVFDVGSTSNVGKNLEGWNARGDVVLTGRNGKLGAGKDLFPQAELWDGENNPQTALYDELETDSSTGLISSCVKPCNWQTVTAAPAVLDAGKDYRLGFELNKPRLGQCEPVAKLDIDNASLTKTTKVAAVPSPGAIMLASIGAAFVGWLRNRKAI